MCLTDGEGIVRFQRTIEGHRTVGDRANVEAIFRGDQLARGVDARKRARHPAEPMNADPSAFKVSLEQPFLEDVGPPCGIGSRIIGRSLAEMAMLRAKDGCWHALDHVRLASSRDLEKR
jgi:hypothetical protein